MPRWLLAVLMTAAGVAGCSRSGSDTEQAAPRPVVEVRIDSVRVGPVAATVRAPGATRALRQETVAAPVDGQVASLDVLPGEAVHAGAVLARLETKESVAGRAGAEMLLGQAATPEARARAEADLQRARRNATVLEVRAPFDAVVVTRAANPGEYVSAGGALFDLVDLGSLCFVARVTARDLARIHPGEPAHVEFESTPPRRVEARVESVNPQLDPAAQTAEVRLRFTPAVPANLQAETFGFATIVIGGKEAALLVPHAAVLRDDATGDHTLVEAVGDTLGIIRHVAIGLEADGAVEVSGAGLRGGMHVVVEGHYGLPDSTRLSVAGLTDAP
jgi:multidrug efflux pump subunit AcrA (membrane-fusion protein)